VTPAEAAQPTQTKIMDTTKRPTELAAVPCSPAWRTFDASEDFAINCTGYERDCQQQPHLVWEIKPALFKNRMVWIIDLCERDREFSEWACGAVMTYNLNDAKRYCEHPDAYDAPSPPKKRPSVKLLKWIKIKRVQQFIKIVRQENTDYLHQLSR
jgi:hypothetical protein